METRNTDELEVVEEMPLEMQGLASLLASLTDTQLRLTAEIDKVKKQMIKQAGEREYAPLELVGVRVSIVRRKPASKPDVVGLIKAGFKKEEFSTVKTTLTSLQAFAARQKWTDRQLQKFILPGEGEPVTYVRCEVLHAEEEDQ